MRKEIFFLIMMATTALGAGPCDITGDPDPDTWDAGDCGTEEVCTDLLAISVIRADDAMFLSGMYEFTVQAADGTLLTLSCVFNFAEQGFLCNAGNLDELAVTIDPTGKTLEISMAQAPRTVAARIDYNDWTIGERAMTPTYEEVEPNGPGCPPLCFSGTATMAVKSF